MKTASYNFLINPQKYVANNMTDYFKHIKTDPKLAYIITSNPQFFSLLDKQQ